MILSFWGKGGVGKTTCSASLATYLASNGDETLLISSDPSPSLFDIFGFPRRPGGIYRVSGLERLDVIELDEAVVLEMWKERFGGEVFEVVSSFFPVDESILDYIAGAPGISEEFVLAYLLEEYRLGGYDFIVWDTAPAGGTLRLLRLEEQFYEHLGEAGRLYFSVKSVLDRLKRKGGRNPLSIIEEWRALARDVLDFMSSDAVRAFIVTIPEWLGYAQTVRIVGELGEFDVSIGGILVNQVAETGICQGEVWDKRSEVHAHYMEMIREEFGGRYKVKSVPVLPYEVKGVDRLLRFSENVLDLVDIESVKP
ncbi:Putative arsenical pump-driving ATPase [Candidatus Methanoperedenaceae archaeon GB50]|nr:Putative arsenical pump-driving ATPase [Candidatus Methanoperedenaceae archaeon GB50]CAD7781302.1 MAG: Putative arsenical pump-driving ATPase [Candidatus Methanoperedenaceae archaeon GB50]